MKKTFTSLLIVFALPMFWLSSCDTRSDAYKTQAEDPEYIHQAVRRLTDILRHDNFSPPVSSRIYAYSSIAAYEALLPAYPEYKSMAGQLNGLTECPKPEAGKAYFYPLASVHALMKVGKFLVFSESSMAELQETVYEKFDAMKMPQDVYDRSIAFGDAIADHIIKWSKKDNYAQIRSAPKYTIDLNIPGRWVPTPPQYGDAVEPHWPEMRPWVLDSNNQFKAQPPVAFSPDKNSDFYKIAKEVYDVNINLSEAEKATGKYWDDNPFEVQVSGHMMLPTKHISPGGHWMNICQQACRKANTPIMQVAENYMMVALALTDGFISCWTSKYTSNLLRPETYINRYIDPNWHPFIETPPFPEHTSGHATISAACATILTNKLGESFEFTDSTENEFNLGVRTFKSFYEASDEAAVSRLYGGIHYRTGNEAGKANGIEVGKYILQKVKTK